MKDELGGKIMIEFVVHRQKTYSYLIDYDCSKEKVKETKKCAIKKIIKFNNYKNCLFYNEIRLKSQQIFKSEANNIYTEEINKIAVSSKDDKQLQTFGRLTTYPFEKNAFKICEIEMLSKYK